MATTYLLTKLSAPGWEKEFIRESDVRLELSCWVCKDCLDELEEDGLDIKDVYNLLLTACGCEFMLEVLDG